MAGYDCLPGCHVRSGVGVGEVRYSLAALRGQLRQARLHVPVGTG